MGILVYGYATGVFSSRKLERATFDSVAFRFIAVNDHPDYDMIAALRRSFLKEIEALFVQLLLLAREMGVLKLGTVALDGTKIRANASLHSALSYEHAGKIEAQLTAEVAALLAKAEAADATDIPDGMSIPDEAGVARRTLALDRPSARKDRGARQGATCARAGGARSTSGELHAQRPWRRDRAGAGRPKRHAVLAPTLREPHARPSAPCW